MKHSGKILMSIVTLFVLSGVVHAQESFSSDSTKTAALKSNNTMMKESQDSEVTRSTIKLEEVPLAIRDGLTDNGYEFNEVYKVYKAIIEKPRSTIYEFMIEKEGAKWVVYFDERGNYISKKEVG